MLTCSSDKFDIVHTERYIYIYRSYLRCSYGDVDVDVGTMNVTASSCLFIHERSRLSTLVVFGKGKSIKEQLS